MKTSTDLQPGAHDPLSRRGFLGNLGKGLSLAALAPEVARHIAWATGQPSPTRKPNILLILADDMGYGDL